MRLLLCLLTLLSLVNATAWASTDGETHMYLEPAAGMVSAKFNSEDGADSAMGALVGGNLGWRKEYFHFFFTGGYQYFMPSEDDAGLTANWQQYSFGLGLGWEWNIPLMTTVAMEQMITKVSAEGNGLAIDATTEGIAFKFGMSYFFSDNLKFNVAYATYHGTEDDEKYSRNMVSGTLSIPFDISYPDEWWRARQDPTPD